MPKETRRAKVIRMPEKPRARASTPSAMFGGLVAALVVAACVLAPAAVVALLVRLIVWAVAG